MDRCGECVGGGRYLLARAIYPSALPFPTSFSFFPHPLLLFPCFRSFVIPRFPPMFKVPLITLLNMDGVGMRP